MTNFCQITDHVEVKDIQYLLDLNDTVLKLKLDLFSNASKYVPITESRRKLEELLIDKIPGAKLYQCKVLNNLWTFLPPFILLFGTFGNILALYVIFQRNLLKTSSYVYLVAITIVDELILLTGLLRRWTDHLIGQRVEDTSAFLCKTFQFIGVTVTFSSVWLIVLMTIERLIIIKMPLKANSFIKSYKVKVYVITLVLILSLISSHFFETVTLIEQAMTEENIQSNMSFISDMKCRFKKNYVSFIRYWIIFETLLYSIIPFLLLIILNGVILKETYTAGKARSNMIRYNPSTKMSKYIQNCRNNTVVKHTMTYETKQLTIMLVTISFAFLCTTTPLVSWKLILQFIEKSNDIQNLASQQLLDTIFELLMYINHSINFYIYCASGRRFRSQLWKIIKKKECTNLYSVSFSKPTARIHSAANITKM